VTIETPSMIQTFLDTLRPEIKNLPLYNAGLSVEYVRSQYGVGEIAKLGSNENPYGASPRVRQAVADAANEIAIYPEASCDPLRVVVAEWLGVAQNRLLFGNGSEDIIWTACHMAPIRRRPG
jgi:histidinol-phosphate aminotransferase